MSDAAREQVKSFIAEHEFDSVVVILGDRKELTLTNWWHFSGHPNWWTNTDCATVAQHMVATTAEVMKTDVNVGREIKYTGPKIERVKTQQAQNYAWLGGIAIHINRRSRKRLYLNCWIDKTSIGMYISWYNGLNILIGPFLFASEYHE